MFTRKIAILLAISLWSVQSYAERIKDIADVSGVRSNALIGYGLVVGLAGSGDKTEYADQSLLSMLNKFGINLPPGTKTNSKNIAAVAVHAELPAFAKPGHKVDVTVSSLGNAKSLSGGTLLLTPLKGVDGNVYGLAQGSLLVGGLDSSKGDGSKITVTASRVGRVPNGGVIERSVSSGFELGNTITLNLKTPDFTTANNLRNAINDLLGAGTASALDGSSVEVLAPRVPSQRVSFLSVIENIEVVSGLAAAKVIINSRTGTVVIGSHVQVSAAAVTHGSMVVKIDENLTGNNPFGGGAVTPNAAPGGKIKKGRMFKFSEGVKLDDIIQAVNKVGASPSDIVAILEALKQAGALKAELLVI